MDVVLMDELVVVICVEVFDFDVLCVGISLKVVFL